MGYILNEEKRFHVYVANRMGEIRERSEPGQWHYAPTYLNPADAASRGLSARELVNSSWTTGPEFLWMEEIRMLQQGQPLTKSSRLYKLDPFLKDGILRIGGRIRKAHVSFNMKHPVVLPKDHHVSE